MAALVAAWPSVAAGQPAPAASTAAPSLEETAARAAKADELNKQGASLLEAGDSERALEYFMKSRAVMPTTKNVTNAAISLDALGRYDESLELLEELLVKELAAGLDEQDRAALGPMITDLRAKVASVNVSSDAGGEVTIDGRPRGKLPLLTPLRVLAGQHTIRITRNGYKTFEAKFDAKTGAAVTVHAKLEPLQGVGQLVVEDEGADKADVYVDAVKVGSTPWEGSLAPGDHLVWTQRADQGTAPTPAVVVEGQAALLTLQSRPLGAPVQLAVEPREASIELAGANVGKGVWEGRLPVGSHSVRIEEDGYFPKSITVESEPGKQPQALAIKLDIDESHPRWPKAITGDIWAGVFGGFSGGADLGGTPDQSCPEACDGSSSMLGFLAGLRGGYRFPIGVSVELGAGYWRMGSSYTRTLLERQGDIDVTYALENDTLVHGPFGALGVSYRGYVDDADRFHLLGRLSVGMLIARVSNPIEGTASTSVDQAPVFMENRSEVLTSIAPFVMPELGGGVDVGPLEIGLSLGIGIFPTNGPDFERGRFGALKTPGAGGGDPQSVQNTQESSIIGTERAYSSFLVWVPQMTVQRTF